MEEISVNNFLIGKEENDWNIFSCAEMLLILSVNNSISALIALVNSKSNLPESDSTRFADESVKLSFAEWTSPVFYYQPLELDKEYLWKLTSHPLQK